MSVVSFSVVDEMVLGKDLLQSLSFHRCSLFTHVSSTGWTMDPLAVAVSQRQSHLIIKARETARKMWRVSWTAQPWILTTETGGASDPTASILCSSKFRCIRLLTLVLTNKVSFRDKVSVPKWNIWFMTRKREKNNDRISCNINGINPSYSDLTPPRWSSG